MALRNTYSINRPRNRFQVKHRTSTTFDGGLVIPLTWYEILPGDTLELKMSYICRMLTPLNPVMDNAFLDVKAFFVKNQNLWEHWCQFMGQNDSSAWTDSNVYTIPVYGLTQGALDRCSIGDYLGLPTARADSFDLPADTSMLPLRGYISIWNYWYRDQNVVAPVLFSKGDGPDEINVTIGMSYNSKPLPSMKLPDYFTTALPEPQKIAPINLNPASPVDTGVANYSSTRKGNSGGVKIIESSNGYTPDPAVLSTASSGVLGADGTLEASSVGGAYKFSNLWAQNSAITIEDIRRAAVYQHVGEILARGGSRYASEFLPNIFGVTNSSALEFEPEYLGGFSRLINMTEVLSNADTDLPASGDDPSTGRVLGSNGAMSKTTGDEFLVRHTFAEHGMVYILATVRHEETYFQGIEKKWTRSSFWDFYLPQAQGLGFQKIYKRELYQGAGVSDSAVFGYQDYGAEYRFVPNRLTGRMRPTDGQTGLDTWTWTSVFASAPTLNEAFMKADSTGFTRTIAVDTENTSQFFGDFLFQGVWTRVVGVQRFPGLDKI